MWRGMKCYKSNCLNIKSINLIGTYVQFVSVKTNAKNLIFHMEEGKINKMK